MGILKKYKKDGVVITGSDNIELDTPIFEITHVGIDTVASVLRVEVIHTITQGSLEQRHSRSFEVAFSDLSTPIKQAGKTFLDAIEQKILSLPQYQGSIEQ